jgi:hypothetical protein
MSILAIGTGYYVDGRVVPVFGENLNTPSFSAATYPSIYNPTNNFDFTSLKPGHEAVAALMTSDTYLYGPTTVDVQWYRNSDNKLLYHGVYSVPDPAAFGYQYWRWWYIDSYIGYVWWEIAQNGGYTVVFTIPYTGETLTQSFQVVGVGPQQIIVPVNVTNTSTYGPGGPPAPNTLRLSVYATTYGITNPVDQVLNFAAGETKTINVPVIAQPGVFGAADLVAMAWSGATVLDTKYKTLSF